jgi:HlyD family secretion protein
MKILRILLLVVLILTLVGVTFWYVTTQTKTTASTPLAASGTVETTQVSIAPEITGKVIEISIDEGAPVTVGEVLFKLDSTLLQAQLAQARANLAVTQAGLEAAKTAHAAAQSAVVIAQAQYNQALASARLQAEPAVSSAWSQTEPIEFTLPVWYFSYTEEITAALQAVSVADSLLSTAQTELNTLVNSSAYVNLASIETRLSNAQASFLNASAVLGQAKLQSDQTLRDSAQQAYDASKAGLDAAQNAYANLLTTQQINDILEARARLAVAQQQYDLAMDRYNALLTGENSLAVKLAADGVAQAQANATAAGSKITQAQKAIDQAQAAVNLINVQLAKLVITAPLDGVVLSRNIQPGEVILAGGSAFTLGALDRLTITVYIPENRYGEVKLGQLATVKVDSFPNQTFEATVTHISDQAEFTPRNVQTIEGRQTTVFAIELSVQNSGELLKPGMPADVTFSQP